MTGVPSPSGGPAPGLDDVATDPPATDPPATDPPVIDRSALMHNYAEPPVTFVRGAGSTLVDTEGREYLDFLSGLAVTSLGHAHPQVAEAIADQARTLSHVSNLFGNTLGPEVAATLDRLIGGGTERAGGQVFFGNSGAEANECAIKLARRWAGPGRFAVVSTWDAFHGRTLATLAATGQPEKQAAFRPLPDGFDHVAFDDLDAMDEACDPARVAAVLVEPILGEAGVVVPSSDYLKGLRQLCTDRNILLIVDEVQTGLGRTGEWFGFQHLGLEPDVVTMAKALGNGMPVGACWARAEVAAAFVPGDHGSTFGGQPLAMAAARATLAVMESENVPWRARTSGARLRAGLQELPGVASVRGEGLLLAAVLTDPVAVSACRESLGRGLVVNAPQPDVLRFAPSLLVSDADIDKAVGIVGSVLAGLTGATGSTGSSTSPLSPEASDGR
jgi:acetylornithine/N-succinyldiaminopimelate aminotransferase